MTQHRQRLELVLQRVFGVFGELLRDVAERLEVAMRAGPIAADAQLANRMSRGLGAM